MCGVRRRTFRRARLRSRRATSGAAQKVCKISSALNIPPGVSLDLGGAELDQITAGADAIASIWTVAGSSYGYGNQEGIIKHGVIVGPGQGVSTGAGIHVWSGSLSGAMWKYLLIWGF